MVKLVLPYKRKSVFRRKFNISLLLLSYIELHYDAEASQLMGVIREGPTSFPALFGGKISNIVLSRPKLDKVETFVIENELYKTLPIKKVLFASMGKETAIDVLTQKFSATSIQWEQEKDYDFRSESTQHFQFTYTDFKPPWGENTRGLYLHPKTMTIGPKAFENVKKTTFYMIRDNFSLEKQELEKDKKVFTEWVSELTIRPTHIIPKKNPFGFFTGRLIETSGDVFRNFNLSHHMNQVWDMFAYPIFFQLEDIKKERFPS